MKEFISEHQLDPQRYSLKTKIYTILTLWGLFLGVYFLLQLESVQSWMVEMAFNLNVNWIYKVVDFVLNGFIFVGIPILIYTISAVVYKPKFTQLKVYTTGLEFISDIHSNFVEYHQIKLSHINQRGFKMSCAMIKMSEELFVWKEFSNPDQFKEALNQYGVWTK